VEGGVVSNVEMTSTGFKATRESGTSYGAKLRDAVETYEKKNWPTVTVGEEKYRIKGNSQASKCLSAMAARGELGHPDQANLSTTGKSQGSQQWATPRANKVHPVITEENREHLANRNKSNLEEEIAGHCGKAQGKLNPDWVEQLMGLPVGWTDLGSWATE